MMRIFVFAMAMSICSQVFATQEVSEEEFIALIEGKPTIAIWGHGSSGQIAHKYQTLSQIKEVVQHYDSKFGKGNWQIIYDGDPSNSAKPDIGYIVQYMRENLGVETLAVTFEKVRDEWGGVPKFVDTAYYMPTKTNEAGEIKWGAIAEFYFQDAMKKSSGEHKLAGVVLAGGGPIAWEQAQRAVAADIDTNYVRVEARFEVNGRFGTIEEELGGLGFRGQCSKVLLQASRGPFVTLNSIIR